MQLITHIPYRLVQTCPFELKSTPKRLLCKFILLLFTLQIQNNEVDFLTAHGICTEQKNVVGLCLPAIQYENYYIWTKYPNEKTKLWNLAKLLTPASWLWTFISILTAVFSLKFACFIGTKLGLGVQQEGVVLFPFRIQHDKIKTLQ